MARFLKGNAAIEHLKAGGTLFSLRSGGGWVEWSNAHDCALEFSYSGKPCGVVTSFAAFDREVRTEPPAIEHLKAGFLEGDAQVEHLKAGGTLWDGEADEDGIRGYWSWSPQTNSPYLSPWGKTFIPHNSRLEVRTKPPVKPKTDVVLLPVSDKPITKELAEQLRPKATESRTDAVGDIVTGDEAYRLVELGAKVSFPIGVSFVHVSDGKWTWMDAFGEPYEDNSEVVLGRYVSHARRTLWNPYADEWRIAAPPKTISAEEARQVVAAGGAVARTFVAPESEWITPDNYEVAMGPLHPGEWVVRRAAPERKPKH